MFLCSSRRMPEFIHSSWVMWSQLHGSFVALAYILNNKSLLKAANYLVPCFGFRSS